MKTLKKVSIVLEEGDQVEVSCDDITLHIEMGFQEGREPIIRVHRPPTDGRFLGIQWSALSKDGGDPVLEKGTANGWVQIEPVTTLVAPLKKH